MTRTMYDSVTVASIPADAQMVGAYVDGHYANAPAARAQFPHAVIVEIAVSASTNAGQVLDVEEYDATPTEAPGWAERRRAAGVDPSVYCNSSTWPAVRAAFAAQGVAEPHYWIAQYDGDPTIPAGAVAKQFRDPGPYDISSVADYWPGIDPTPQEDVVTPQDKQDIINGVLSGIEGAAVRDGLAFANLWWLERVATGNTAGMNPAQAGLVTSLHEGLTQLVHAAVAAPSPVPAAVEAVPAAAEVAPAPTETTAEPAAS